MNPDVEARFQRIEAALELMATRQKNRHEAFGRMNPAISKLDSNMAKLTDTMDRLANIVIRHEERLDDIQGEQ